MISKDQLRRLLPTALDDTDLPLSHKNSGKVRDWYALPDGKRLIITTDRLSAFDRILAAVPYKGQVLNQLSAWWRLSEPGARPSSAWTRWLLNPLA